MVDDLVAAGRAAGLDAVGVTAAAPFATTRRHLADRKAAGLHGGMRFTYLHPDRSADPTTALPDARSLVVGARSYRRALDAPADTAVADAGRPVNEIWRQYGISSATSYKWKAKYGGLDASDVKRLKELEHENGRLKRMYADLSLENAALKDVIAKNL